jgi:hypothetical protein
VPFLTLFFSDLVSMTTCYLIWLLLYLLKKNIYDRENMAS